METPLLISKADFTGRIDISSNLLPTRLNEHIRHAEDFDLCELLGDRFYYYFLSFFDAAGTLIPSAPQTIIDLYNGGSYSVEPTEPLSGVVSSDPNAFVFTPSALERSYPGIKPVLVYFAGARHVRAGDYHITPTGIMSKNNDYSDHISNAAKNNIATQHNSQALAYWRKNYIYLDLHQDLYPQFFDKSKCGCTTSRKGNRPRTINL